MPMLAAMVTLSRPAERFVFGNTPAGVEYEGKSRVRRSGEAFRPVNAAAQAGSGGGFKKNGWQPEGRDYARSAADAEFRIPSQRCATAARAAAVGSRCAQIGCARGSSGAVAREFRRKLSKPAAAIAGSTESSPHQSPAVQSGAFVRPFAPQGLIARTDLRARDAVRCQGRLTPAYAELRQPDSRSRGRRGTGQSHPLALFFTEKRPFSWRTQAPSTPDTAGSRSLSAGSIGRDGREAPFGGGRMTGSGWTAIGLMDLHPHVR